MKLARFIGYCILAVSLVYFAVAAGKYADSMPRVPRNPVTATALAASILLYLVQSITSGYAWHLWLRTLHEPPRPAVAYRVVTLLGDGAAFVLGYLAERRLSRRP